MVDAMQRLIGVWQLVGWEIAYDDARQTTYPFGEDAHGIILYTPDGGMNASIARHGRIPLSSESTRTAPAAEKIAAFDSFFNYGGTYSIRGECVVHRVEVALNPGFVGTEQVRKMEFAEDDKLLTLSASDHVPDSKVLRHHRLIWRRA